MVFYICTGKQISYVQFPENWTRVVVYDSNPEIFTVREVDLVLIVKISTRAVWRVIERKNKIHTHTCKHISPPSRTDISSTIKWLQNHKQMLTGKITSGITLTEKSEE